MENASKALILAGSVLIVIIIIGVSIFVLNATKDPVARTVDNMSKEERSFFNSKFRQYEGGRVSGLETKALINLCMQNAYTQFNMKEQPRIPELTLTTKTENFSLKRSDIQSFSGPEDFKERFQKMLNKTVNTSFYSVQIRLNANNGIVSEIYITELNI